MDIVEDLRKDPYEEERQYKREARLELGNMLDKAADTIERLRNNQSIIIASFRINMMRLCPDYSPEEFDKDIADIVGEKG